MFIFSFFDNSICAFQQYAFLPSFTGQYSHTKAQLCLTEPFFFATILTFMETIFKEAFLLFLLLIAANSNSLLLPTSPNCAFTDNLGNCLNCEKGYFLNNWMCYLGNPYCYSYDVDGSCLDCTEGNLVGNMCLVQANCTSVDAQGNCLLCPVGFQLMDAHCYSSASLFPYCKTLNGSVCTACVAGAYLSNGACAVGNPFCATSDVAGKCLSCLTTLTLRSAYCVSIDVCLTSEPSTSNCLTCKSSFTLMSGKCSPWNTVSPFCSVFNRDASCSQCLLGYYLSAKLCVPVSSLCYTYEMKTGKCKSCYNGYVLSGPSCLASTEDNITAVTSTSANAATSNTTTSNSSCGQGFYWDNVTGVCTQSCSSGFALSGTTCVQLSVLVPFCSSFIGSACQSCMNGYYLGNGVCLPGNLQCLTYNMIGGSCLSCYPRYYLRNGSCLAMNQLCNTVDANGNCASCFAGFVVYRNSCVSFGSINPQCSSFSGVNCINCYQGYYIGSNGICKAANPSCQTYSMTTGACLSCHLAYTLKGTDCIYKP